jgi:hypothetical protein
MTINQIKANLKKEYPSITELHNGEEVELSAAEYSARIDEWAAEIYAKEQEVEAEALKAEQKQALLDRLGITTEEAKLLLG